MDVLINIYRLAKKSLPRPSLVNTYRSFSSIRIDWLLGVVNTYRVISYQYLSIEPKKSLPRPFHRPQTGKLQKILSIKTSKIVNLNPIYI